MISVENLTFRYPGTPRNAVEGLGFQVGPGEVFGFLGPSGAGKSTTLKILTGLLKGYQGTVRVLGASPAARARDIFQRLGVSFEFPNLYGKLTARENLEFFAALFSGPTRGPGELLQMVGLAEAAQVRVAHFSKGMKMRLNFARALINRPQVLFLDEPTAGLDPPNARIIRDIVLAEKAEGKTIFLTTHNMTVAEELCDRVAFLVDGGIRTTGAPRALMAEAGQRRVRVTFGENGATATRDFDMEHLADDPAFLAQLRKGALQSIHSMDATLEEVFLRATGKKLQ